MASAPPHHFNLVEWMDFVRRTLPPEHQSAMLRHLEHDQCSECRNTLARLGEAYETARTLEAYAPPDATLARAKAIFQPVPQYSWWALPVRLAEVVAETFRSPEFASGWRHVEAEPAQVFRGGAMLCRLKIDFDAAGNTLVLGTISDENAETSPVLDCPIYAVSGKRVLAETRTNQFGEFLLEFPPTVRLRLVLVPPGANERIELKLDAKSHS